MTQRNKIVSAALRRVHRIVLNLKTLAENRRWNPCRSDSSADFLARNGLQMAESGWSPWQILTDYLKDSFQDSFQDSFRDSGRFEQILASRAADISRGYHFFYGTMKVQTGFPPRWDTTTESKYSDIKDQRDLTRLHQCLQLAVANCSDKAIAVMLSFIRTQRPLTGLGWDCPMDVAIRGANMAVALELILSSRKCSSQHLCSNVSMISDTGPILISLIEHHNFVSRRLEIMWDGSVTNHYLANIASLWIISSSLERFAGQAVRPLLILPSNAAKGIFPQKYWLAAFEREAERQILVDGFFGESSTGYHRLAAEMFCLCALAMALETGNAHDTATLSGQGVLDGATKLMETLQRLRTFHPLIPSIGDEDGGNFLPLFPTEPRDTEWLVKLWEKVTDMESTFRKKSNEKIQQEKTQSPCMTGKNENSLLLWPRAGLALMCRGAMKVLAAFTPNGRDAFTSGHSHNDKLSFSLALEGEVFITDPGTGRYTGDPELRDILRSTSSHSTFMVNGIEQNPFHSGKPFFLEDISRATATEFSSMARPAQLTPSGEHSVQPDSGDDDFTPVVKALHHGYRAICGVCSREWFFQKSSLVIRDRTEVFNEKGEIVETLILAPSIKSRISGTSTIELSSASAAMEVEFRPCPAFLETLSVPFSPGYGQVTSSERIIAVFSVSPGEMGSIEMVARPVQADENS
jgi:hypothetical protein